MAQSRCNTDNYVLFNTGARTSRAGRKQCILIWEGVRVFGEDNDLLSKDMSCINMKEWVSLLISVPSSTCFLCISVVLRQLCMNSTKITQPHATFTTNFDEDLNSSQDIKDLACQSAWPSTAETAHCRNYFFLILKPENQSISQFIYGLGPLAIQKISAHKKNKLRNLCFKFVVRSLTDQSNDQRQPLFSSAALFNIRYTIPKQ